MKNMPLNPPRLIRSINENRWKDALTYLVIKNKNCFIIERYNVWLYKVERDINNKMYAFQQIFLNNNLIDSIYTKLPIIN